MTNLTEAAMEVFNDSKSQLLVNMPTIICHFDILILLKCFIRRYLLCSDLGPQPPWPCKVTILSFSLLKNNIAGTLSTVLAIITINRNTDYGVGHYHPSQGTCHHKEEETVDIEIFQISAFTKWLNSITTR